jgi:hypothetical protein
MGAPDVIAVMVDAPKDAGYLTIRLNKTNIHAA